MKSYPIEGPSVRGILWWPKPENRRGKAEYGRFLRKTGFSKKRIDDMDRMREKMITENQGLVISVAGKWAGAGVDFLDLVQEGNLGMLLAVDKYDPSLPTKFATMAIPWIRKYIRETVMQRHLVHVPFSQQIDEAKKARENRVMHAKDGEELMSSMVRNQNHIPNPWDDEIYDTPIKEEVRIELSRSVDIEENLDEKQKQMLVQTAFWRLSKRERMIIDRHFDLFDEEDREVFNRLIDARNKEESMECITKQRVSQVFQRAKRKMIAMIQNNVSLSPSPA